MIRLRQAPRIAAERGVQLPQPHELAHKLGLELTPQILAPHADPRPGIPPGEHPVRVADLLVLDREGVRRLAPLSLGEDQRRRISRAHPAGERRLERRK